MLLFTAPPTVRIVHSGQACNVEEERYSERVYTIKEGETLELQCLVTGHPRPQVTTCWVYWERFDFVCQSVEENRSCNGKDWVNRVEFPFTLFHTLHPCWFVGAVSNKNLPLSSAACWSARAPAEWSYCGAFEFQKRQQSHSDEEEEQETPWGREEPLLSVNEDIYQEWRRGERHKGKKGKGSLGDF